MSHIHDPVETSMKILRHVVASTPKADDLKSEVASDRQSVIIRDSGLIQAVRQ